MASTNGQTLVEYAIALVIISCMAYVGMRLMPQCLGSFYRSLATQRTGIRGLLP